MIINRIINKITSSDEKCWPIIANMLLDYNINSFKDVDTNNLTEDQINEIDNKIDNIIKENT